MDATNNATLNTLTAIIKAHPLRPTKLQARSIEGDIFIVADYGDRQVELRVDRAPYGGDGYAVSFSCYSANGSAAELVAQAALLTQVGALAVALEAVLGEEALPPGLPR